MALPLRTASSWHGGLDFPSRLLEFGEDDYELYEQDDEFVLNVELPGYEREEITVSWDDGMLNIAAEHEDEERNRRRTYHRRFRFPKTIEDDEIAARYTNGVLEVRLPVETEATVSGREITVE